MNWRIVLTLLFIGILSGCAHTEDLQVSAITAKDAPVQYKKFVIVSDKNEVVDNDLTFSEFARQVASVLDLQGYVQVKNLDDAQIMVVLTFHISEPQTKTEIVNTPVYPTVGPFYPGRFGYYPYPLLGYPVYQPMVHQSIVYKKLVRLQALDAAAYANQKIIKPLWDIQITSNNQNGDLRYMFPYMLVAAQPYIGQNTGHSINVSVDDKDPMVAALRAGE